jgi:DnaK suppressor protein
MAEKRSYSDEELEEFKGIINQKISEHESEIVYQKSIVEGLGNGTDDTYKPSKSIDEAAENYSKEEATRMINREQRAINHLKNALIRIENKTYGRCNCSECNGDLISKERLRSTPHATKCMLEKMRVPN